MISRTSILPPDLTVVSFMVVMLSVALGDENDTDCETD